MTERSKGVTGRNDPCPCGSGKKFKHCCLKRGEHPASGLHAETLSIPGAIQVALEHHQAGRLAQAETIYRQILQLEPNQTDALHLLGMLAHQTGNSKIAVELVGRAIAGNPGYPMYYNNLGTIYERSDELGEAEACYYKALALKPDYADALYNLGCLYKKQGKPAEAVVCFQKALGLKPDYVEAHNNLGATLKDMGRLDEAVACYQKALEYKPDYAEAYLNLGSVLKDQGRQEEAIARYRKALALIPDYPSALYSLGVVLKEQGKLDEAIACYQKAIELKHDYVEAYNNLCVALKDMGRLDEALACCRKALEYQPGYVDAHNNLGSVLKELGEIDEAVACYKRALELEPDHVYALYNFGNVLKEQDKLEDAAACFRRVLEHQPGFVDAHNNLGNVLEDQDRLDEAAAEYRAALALQPDYAFALYNLGNVLKKQDRLEEAVSCYQGALELKPHYADAILNLGNALKELHKLGEAIACYQRVLELKPDYVEAYLNVGNVLKDQFRMDEAIVYYQKALEFRPDYVEAYLNLGNVFKDQCKLSEAAAHYRKALAFKPGYTDAHTNLIFTLDLSPDVAATALQQERRSWDEAHAAPLLQLRAHNNTPDPERRLRIGYVSADLRNHSAAFVFGAMLVRFDPSRFDVYAYSNTTNEDAYTQLFQQRVTCWRKIVGMSDESVANLIRHDEIDILVDLSGYTVGNRLLVFARKPAPIQVTAWGYATSTGMRAMDVFFADPVVVPPEEKSLFAEDVRYLPSVVGFFCPEIFPPVNALPALSQGVITFGSFNRLAKITDAAFNAWAQVLLAIPNSRMVLKATELGDQGTRSHVLQKFVDGGVAPERITLLGKTTRQEHVAAFNLIDIALDPFPHGGGVTTLEGLMMGIPHVTLRWPSIAGRLSASILTTLGFTDWIADTPEQYVQIAVQKAQDLAALAELRGRLRGLFTSSVIGDPNLYVAAVEKEYRQLWREWCERQPNCLSKEAELHEEC